MLEERSQKREANGRKAGAGRRNLWLMLRILKAELDLAVGKIQFHLTESYLILKYFYML